MASPENGWMNTPLTLQWIQKILGSFSFNQRLLAWNSFECHIEQSVCKELKSKKVGDVIIPGGCTKYTQAPDVSWNKPFKAKVAANYDEWLATVGLNMTTEEGNLKSPPRKAIIEWILQARIELDSDMIKKSMKSCSLNLAIDGSEDTLLHSLKEGQPCHSGMSMLKQQIEFLNEPSIDPFLFDENDVGHSHARNFY